MLALADFVLSGDERHLATVEEVDGWLLDQARPDIYDEGDERNVLLLARRRFGALCAALADQGFPRAHELSTFDFHSAIAYLTEKHSRASE